MRGKIILRPLVLLLGKHGCTSAVVVKLCADKMTLIFVIMTEKIAAVAGT